MFRGILRIVLCIRQTNSFDTLIRKYDEGAPVRALLSRTCLGVLAWNISLRQMRAFCRRNAERKLYRCGAIPPHQSSRACWCSSSNRAIFAAVRSQPHCHYPDRGGQEPEA